MVVFDFTNFASLVHKGEGICKISKTVRPLNGHVLMKRPLGVNFCEQVEDRFPAKTCLPWVGGRAVFFRKGDALNPKGANRRFLWFLFRPSREVSTGVSYPLARRQGVLCHRCRLAGYGRRAPSSR